MIIVESVVKQIKEMPMMPISAKVCYIFQTQFISCFLSIELLRFAWSSLAAAGTNLILMCRFQIGFPNLGQFDSKLHESEDEPKMAEEHVLWPWNPAILAWWPGIN